MIINMYYSVATSFQSYVTKAGPTGGLLLCRILMVRDQNITEFQPVKVQLSNTSHQQFSRCLLERTGEVQSHHCTL